MREYFESTGPMHHFCPGFHRVWGHVAGTGQLSSDTSHYGCSKILQLMQARHAQLDFKTLAQSVDKLGARKVVAASFAKCEEGALGWLRLSVLFGFNRSELE
jgi:hypothetical protein